MSEQTMDERVGNLEKLAQTLAPLPAQVAQLDHRVADVESRLGNVESQIVQLRTEMGDEFSAVRKEMSEMNLGLQEDIASLGRDTAAGFLRAGVEMRALFEEHLGRRAVIAEGNPTPDEPPSAP